MGPDLRMREEIVQPPEPPDDTAQSGRDHGCGRVCEMLPAIHVVGADFRLESALHLGGVAAEGKGVTTARNVDHLETLRLEPGGDPIDVVLAETETVGILFGSQPSVKVRRGRILLLLE